MQKVEHMRTFATHFSRQAGYVALSEFLFRIFEMCGNADMVIRICIRSGSVFFLEADVPDDRVNRPYGALALFPHAYEQENGKSGGNKCFHGSDD